GKWCEKDERDSLMWPYAARDRTLPHGYTPRGYGSVGVASQGRPEGSPSLTPTKAVAAAVMCLALLALGTISSRPGGVTALRESNYAGTARRFAWFTDTHVEPFFQEQGADESTHMCRRVECIALPNDGCTVNFAEKSSYDYIPLLGCDPPLTLLESALSYSSGLDPIDAVIFTGDLPAHYLKNRKAIDAVQRVVMQRFSAAYPGKPFLFAIGNNDFHPNGVSSTSELSRLWSVLGESVALGPAQGSPSDVAERRQTFLAGG
ncbi:unnamed protein product, partial [Chrysoparadoxa australica]